MKWTEAKVVFETDDMMLAEELISDIFYEFNLQGVVVDQPDLEPVEGWGDDAVEKPEKNAVSGYFPDNELREEKIRKLESALADLKNRMGIQYQVGYASIDEEDWAHAWKAYFWPEKVGKRCVVKPTWRDYEPHQDDIVIEIDPGMAFGTGTHPTTSLCVNMIERHMAPGISVLDVGTGSGILLIAALKLGAGYAMGIDNDEIAVDIARKNVRQNGISSNRFDVALGHLASRVNNRYDLVVANILADVVISLLDNVGTVMKQNGVLICSGIVDNQEQRVVDNMVASGFDIVNIHRKDDWVAISARLRQFAQD